MHGSNRKNRTDNLKLVAGTRQSRLALWQTARVTSVLMGAGHEVKIRKVVTTGDKNLESPLAEIGSKGLFTTELDTALRDGSIDFAVHSLKDLPTLLPDGLRIAAVVKRGEPWDAFVAGPGYDGMLETLPPGSRIATSSLRRQAQLLAWHPNLNIVPVRGNVETRLQRLRENGWEGMILAEAGLRRLGFEDAIRQRMPAGIMLPAAGQGAIAVVTAEESHDLFYLFKELLDDRATGIAVTAERSFLRKLEGGCQVPIGAFARADEHEGKVSLEGCIASIDGSNLVRDKLSGATDEADSLGIQLAERLLSRGARKILASIRPADSAELPVKTKPLVVLFRQAQPPDAFENAFEASGFQVVSVPLLRYTFKLPESLFEVLSHPENYGGLAVTSPRALDAIEEHPEALERLQSLWKEHPIFVMSPTTQRRCHSLGLRALGAEAGSGSALAEFIAEHRPDQPIVYLSGRPRREEFVKILTKKEVDFDEIVVYRAFARQDFSPPQSAAEWVVFFSPRGVRIAAESASSYVQNARMAAIGPTTAAMMEELGWRAQAVAPMPTPEAMLSAIRQQMKE